MRSSSNLSNTEPSDYRDRLEAWESALESAEKHIKLGQTLQGQGVKALQELQRTLDVDDMAKASNVISTGIKIEREGRSWAIELNEMRPRMRTR